MHFLKVLILILVTSVLTHAQRTCASHEIFEQEMLTNPTFKQTQEFLNKQTPLNRSAVEGIITIPVVVHIVYNHEGENLSEEQILSQLEVLNEDFRRLNADADNVWSQASDAEIEFCLATRDPYGDATCGITRTYTDSTKFILKTSMKSDATGGKTGWPADQYLNMWVCDISGLLGFATFPGGNLDIDGVVTDYLSFGTIGTLNPDFALGRTTTHEIGHWLNLRHIWGDGDCFNDDFVSDTPVSDDHNYGCDIGHISCGSLDMVQNYMDYSDDVCMNLFTQGQKSRMRALFEPGEFRESLLSSPGCQAPIDCDNLFITFNFDSYPGDITWFLIDSGEDTVASGGNYGTSFENMSLELSFCLPDDSYNFVITDGFGDGMCCEWGNGNYMLSSTYQNIYTSNGQFGNGETISFDMQDVVYRFVGPGNQWNDSANWNKLDPPSPCYNGNIFIDTECEVENLILDGNQNIIIRSGGELTAK